MTAEKEKVRTTAETVKGHVFYCFEDKQKYVQNVVTYIIAGIKQGDHVLLVENNKLYSIIQKELQKHLNKEQLVKIKYVNNFDFYFMHNTFHPEQVLAFCFKTLQPFLKEGTFSVRTWGHVEWREDENIEKEIRHYEGKLDEMVDMHQITAVCAYDKDRLSENLKTKLIECHDFFMEDESIIEIK